MTTSVEMVQLKGTASKEKDVIFQKYFFLSYFSKNFAEIRKGKFLLQP
jgi:hypothetical protein